MAKFGHVQGYSPMTVLRADLSGEEQTAEMQRREAAIQKIKKSQLQKILTNPMLGLAAGIDGFDLNFSASELPSAFFADGAWDHANARGLFPATSLTKRHQRLRLSTSSRKDA